MHVDTATIVVWVVGWLLPHASAYASNNKVIPAWAGGYVTSALAVLSGLGGELVQVLADNHDYSITKALGMALGAFLTASVTRLVVHRDTPVERKALDVGAPRAMRRGGKPAPGPGPYQPEHEFASDTGSVLVVVLLVLLILFLVAGGFAYHLLWWFIIVAVIVLIYALVTGRRVP
jgi:hypothetical protein